jgi:hypothetical protein
VKDGKHTLFVVSADGTGEKQVGAFAQEPGDIWWKPSGDGILCALEKDGKGYTLVELDLATGATKPLGDRVWSHIHALRWLPSASGFVVNESTKGEDALWFVSFPEGKVERIPADTHNYSGLGMTADGAKLVSVLMTTRSDLLVAADPGKGAVRKVASLTNASLTFSLLRRDFSGWARDVFHDDALTTGLEEAEAKYLPGQSAAVITQIVLAINARYNERGPAAPDTGNDRGVRTTPESRRKHDPNLEVGVRLN